RTIPTLVFINRAPTPSRAGARPWRRPTIALRSVAKYRRREPLLPPSALQKSEAAPTVRPADGYRPAWSTPRRGQESARPEGRGARRLVFPRVSGRRHAAPGARAAPGQSRFAASPRPPPRKSDPDWRISDRPRAADKPREPAPWRPRLGRAFPAEV